MFIWCLGGRSKTGPTITASEESQEDFGKGPERTYSVVFNEASKGFASMADELTKNKKFNKNRMSIDSGDDSVALQVEKSLRKKKLGGAENSDFVPPKLKPVDPNNTKTSPQSGEKRKSYVPLPSQKSLEKNEGEKKSLEKNEGEKKALTKDEGGKKGAEEEPVTPKPGVIPNCFTPFLGNITNCMRAPYKGFYSNSPVSKPPELPPKTKKPSSVSVNNSFILSSQHLKEQGRWPRRPPTLHNRLILDYIHTFL